MLSLDSEAFVFFFFSRKIFFSVILFLFWIFSIRFEKTGSCWKRGGFRIGHGIYGAFWACVCVCMGACVRLRVQCACVRVPAPITFGSMFRWKPLYYIPLFQYTKLSLFSFRVVIILSLQLDVIRILLVLNWYRDKCAIAARDRGKSRRAFNYGCNMLGSGP